MPEADPIVWRGKKKFVFDVRAEWGATAPGNIHDALNQANDWDPKSIKTPEIHAVHQRATSNYEQEFSVVVRKSGKVELLIEEPK